VARAGEISFDRRTWSEEDADSLKFLIDGELAGAWSGVFPWDRVSYDLEAGPHTLSWVYQKNDALSGGLDRGWIDRIVFPVLVGNLAIATPSLPDWTVGEPYSQQLIADGSLGVLSWSDIGNNLSGTGLSLSTSGLVSGTPTATGLIQFEAEAVDGAGPPVQQAYEIQIHPVPIITTESLPDGIRGDAYSQQLTSAGGTPPLVWSDAYNDLVGTGLSLTSDGLLSGTPTARDELTLTVQLTDNAGVADSRPLSFYLDGGCCEGIVGVVNNNGEPDPTIGDVSALIDALFVTLQPIACLGEADINLSGGIEPTEDDISIGDISNLIDHLFISGIELPDCP
jgi:hypothetical protein